MDTPLVLLHVVTVTVWKCKLIVLNGYCSGSAGERGRDREYKSRLTRNTNKIHVEAGLNVFLLGILLKNLYWIFGEMCLNLIGRKYH